MLFLTNLAKHKTKVNYECFQLGSEDINNVTSFKMTVHFYFENIRKMILLIRKNVCILSEKRIKKKVF